MGKMKVLSILKTAKGYEVVIESGNEYIHQTFPETGEPNIFSRYNKKDYDDYEHFVWVIGKFNPYIKFLKTPIDIKKLSLDELNRAFDVIGKSKWEVRKR